MTLTMKTKTMCIVVISVLAVLAACKFGTMALETATSRA